MCFKHAAEQSPDRKNQTSVMQQSYLSKTLGNKSALNMTLSQMSQVMRQGTPVNSEKKPFDQRIEFE